MKIWERRLLGIVALGGSYLGLALCTAMWVTEMGGLAKVFMVPFAGLYAWGVWCGLRMIEIGDGALRMNRWFWALQVPVFMTPWVGYVFASGALGWVSWEAPMKWGFWMRFGSQFQYSLLEGKPWLLGINVVALAVWWWLGKRLRDARAAGATTQPGAIMPVIEAA